MLEAKVKPKDSLTEDRPSRGQGQEWSRPRTQCGSDLQKMSSLQIFVNFPEHSGVFQKKVFKNIFLASSNKKALQNNFSGDLQMKEKK